MTLLNFDADLVTVEFQGQSVSIYAADFVDDVVATVEAKNKADDSVEHGIGEPFSEILSDALAKAGLKDVKPRRAGAIWDSLCHKAKEYRESFRNGGSSVDSSDSPPVLSSADVALSEVLSKRAEESVPKSD